MSTFTETFRAIVLPDLRCLITALAEGVALGVGGYGRANDIALQHALRRGGTSLPPDVLVNMENWIGSYLLTEIDAAEARFNQARASAIEQWGHTASVRQRRIDLLVGEGCDE